MGGVRVGMGEGVRERSRWESGVHLPARGANLQLCALGRPAVGGLCEARSPEITRFGEIRRDSLAVGGLESRRDDPRLAESPLAVGGLHRVRVGTQRLEALRARRGVSLAVGRARVWAGGVWEVPLKCVWEARRRCRGGGRDVSRTCPGRVSGRSREAFGSARRGRCPGGVREVPRRGRFCVWGASS